MEEQFHYHQQLDFDILQQKVTYRREGKQVLPRDQHRRSFWLMYPDDDVSQSSPSCEDVANRGGQPQESLAALDERQGP